jgi:hypothetical protein
VTTLETNAAMRTIVRRSDGASHQKVLANAEEIAALNQALGCDASSAWVRHAGSRAERLSSPAPSRHFLDA